MSEKDKGLMDDFDNLDKSTNNKVESKSSDSTDKTDEVKTFTQEEVDAMLAKASKGNKDISQSDAIVRLAESIEKQGSKSDSDKYGDDGSQYVDVADIDKDDELDIPIVFFCHSSGYVICDDKRNGVAVLNPYRKKKLEFKHHTTKRRGHNKEQDIEYLAIYKCYSKKEASWLRAHSFFNIKFFDALDSSYSGSHEKSLLVHRNMTAIANWDAAMVRKESQKYGVSSEMDLQDQRVRLAGHLADNQMAENDKKRNARVKESLIDAHMENK